MIDKKQIEHLAKLSRISLSKQEQESFSHQVDDILSFVSSLQKVDTKGIKPGFYLDEKAQTRADEVNVSFDKNDVLAAMPEKKDGLLKTPKIFS